MTSPAPAPVSSTPPKQHYATLNSVFKALSLARSEADAFTRLQTLNPSRDVIRKVIESLAAEGKENFALARYVLAQGWTALRKEKGIPAPRHGDIREYAVLKGKIGGPFIRVPVGALSLGKGERTKVTYAQDRIIIERAPVAQAAA